MLKKIVIGIILLAVFSVQQNNISEAQTKTNTILKEDKTTILRNPGMGWMLYIDGQSTAARGDHELKPFDYPEAFWEAQDANAEYANILYIRAPWSQFEPEEGQYAWDHDENYKVIIEGAKQRGLKIALRAYTHSQDNYRQATPNFVKEAGAEGFNVDVKRLASSYIETVTTTAGSYNSDIEAVYDNNQRTAWGSKLSPTFPQYFDVNLSEGPHKLSAFSFVTHYGQGQGITNVDIQYWNGTKWATAAANKRIKWDKNSEAEESKSVSFPAVSASRFRIKVNSANNQWDKFALNEIRAIFADPEKYWTPYEDDPIFQEKYEAFLDAFAEQYDDPDVVDFVDVAGLGWWGEMHHIPVKNSSVRDVYYWFQNAYRARFHNVLLGAQEGGSVSGYADEALVYDHLAVLRRDSFGSPEWLTQKDKDNILNLWNQGIPVFAENCYQKFERWSTPWSPFYNDLRPMLEQVIADAKYLHANTLDLRRADDATTWVTKHNDLVVDFALNCGYRFVPTEIGYSKDVQPHGDLIINHRWGNRGVGRLPNDRPNWNNKYKVAFAILDKETGEALQIHVDQKIEVADWIKGRGYRYGTIMEDIDLDKGVYDLGVAIVDTTKNNKPSIQLALTSDKTADGWYKVDELRVRTNVALEANVETNASVKYPLTNINDGNDRNAFGTVSGTTLPKEIVFDWAGETKTINGMTLTTHYGKRQGITRFDIEYFDGNQWNLIEEDVRVSWEFDSDYPEMIDVKFHEVEAEKIRVTVKWANYEWQLFAINELKLWSK